MKNSLKALLKKDIRGWLPGAVMYIMAGIGLFLMCAFGIFTGNGDFVVTALSIFVIALILAMVYHLFKGANCYRKNLSDAEYLNALSQKGVTCKGMLLGKMFWTWIVCVITITEYVLFIAFVLFLSKNNYPDDTLIKELRKLFSEAMGEFGTGTIILVYFELVLLMLGLTALVYLAFGLCYRYFIRGKYGFVASLMTAFSMFWVFWKLAGFAIPASGIGSYIGSMIFGVLLGIICTFIHLWVTDKEEKKKL